MNLHITITITITIILFHYFQTHPTKHMSNGRAGSMEAGHGQTIGLNGSSKSIASIHPMLMRSSTDHFSPSSMSMPPPTPMGPTPTGIRREPFDALLRGDDSLANKVQTVIISRKFFNNLVHYVYTPSR